MQFFGFIDVNIYCLDWDFSFKRNTFRKEQLRLSSVLLSIGFDSSLFTHWTSSNHATCHDPCQLITG